MSIKVMNFVWAEGPEDKAETLLLLALADFSDDEGKAYPGINMLAKKSRMSARNVSRILRKLEENGWLLTQENRGRHQTNLYQINLNKTCQYVTPDDLSSPENMTNQTKNLTKHAGKHDKACHPNHQEPLRTVNTSCRFAEALAIWREETEAAGLPQPRSQKPSPKRLAAINARISEHGLDGWRKACQKVAASEFCRGTNNRGWKADIDFLSQPSSIERALDGRYDNRSPQPQNQPETQSQRLRRQAREMATTATIIDGELANARSIDHIS